MILNVYKPPGPTSHDIVDEIRKITGEKKVGHAGTLDPFADGVLIVLVRKEATRRQKEFMGMDKTYIATLRLGATSTTDDVNGEIKNIKLKIKNNNLKLKIIKILKSFIGETEQIPPAYSAKKIKGRKAYELAREGKTPKLKPKRIKIYEIKLLWYRWPYLKIRVRCSSGTYIRALASDIGRKLGCGAYLERLTRTAIGNFTINNSLKLGDPQLKTQIKNL